MRDKDAGKDERKEEGREFKMQPGRSHWEKVQRGGEKKG